MHDFFIFQLKKKKTKQDSTFDMLPSFIESWKFYYKSVCRFLNNFLFSVRFSCTIIQQIQKHMRVDKYSSGGHKTLWCVCIDPLGPLLLLSPWQPPETAQLHLLVFFCISSPTLVDLTDLQECVCAVMPFICT